MNIGELFKFLNSEVCTNFFQNVTHDNKNEMIDKMMNDNAFIETARLYVSDDNIIRSKIETLIGQLMKKTQPVKKNEENGTHIGNGIYLKRECHLIKMTTPDFTVYY
jgi:hypothetical protein